jgi:hypothetical protein
METFGPIESNDAFHFRIISYSGDEFNRMELWCSENLVKYYLTKYSVSCYTEADAIAFKLRWI